MARLVPWLLIFLVFIIQKTSSEEQGDDNAQSDEQKERRHCDMEVCGNIVTKCRLTNRCSCNFKKDIHCAKDCLDCLEEKFGKCCACVDLCPPSKEDTHSSHVGDIPLDKTYDELFEVLTEGDDIHGRWLVEYISDNRIHQLKRHQDEDTDSLIEDIRDESSVNATHSNENHKVCAMTFIHRYLNLIECRKYCRSMGSRRYRWFDDGCCGCLGKYCYGYGIDKPKCVIFP